jgi:Serine acetyltransferase
MKLLEYLYEKRYHKPAPYYYKYSLLTIIAKPIRKFIAQVLAPNCPFNNIRILLYRICGFKIGKNTFIGMHCYLDDRHYDLLKIGNNCIVSYGVYFACHGPRQGHFPIVIEDGVYIGMAARVILGKSENHEGLDITIGKNAYIGACTLVNKNIPAGAVAVGVPCRVIRIETEESNS